MIKKILLRDSIAFGIVLGLAIPLACFYFVFYLNHLALVFFDKQQILSITAMQLLALCANLPLFRMYMLKWDMEQSGKGMLLATFALAFLYIFLHRNHIL